MMVMFRKIIYVFLGFFATVFALNVETGFNDGIMNVTLYEVEGLAQGAGIMGLQNVQIVEVRLYHV